MTLFTAFAAMLTLGCQPSQAHELRPAIADLSRESETLVLTLRLNLEALLAGIPPEHDDSDAAPQAPRYDRLRSLPATSLQRRAEAWSPALLDGLTLSVGAVELEPVLQAIRVPDTGDVRIARDSAMVVAMPWPDEADQLRLAWSREFGALIVRAGAPEWGTFDQYLLPGQRSDPIPLPVIDGRGERAGGAPARGALSTFIDYVHIGVVHIVPRGLDHILFVVGLFLLSARLAPIVWQVSVFTLAHSMTLAAGTLGWVVLPASIVEPLIALSIVLVALENLVSSRLRVRRLMLVFAFGLLHGLGFAGVLSEIGLSANRFLLSLIAFNAGVEIGQLCVVAVCFATVGWFRDAPGYRRAVIVPGSLCVGAVGLFWFVQRLVG